MRPGDKNHIALWDAINDVVAASGGRTDCVSTRRQLAVVAVETALRAIVASDVARLRAALWNIAATCVECPDTAQFAARVLDGSAEPPRCQCQLEAGDSPCRVHGENEETDDR